MSCNVITKICSKCNVEHPLDCYSVSKGKISTICKPCVRIKSKLWYENNKERKLTLDKIWKANNKYKIKEQKSEYKKRQEVIAKESKNRKKRRLENPEKYREKDRKYEAKNRDKINKRKNNYTKKNLEQVKLYRNEWQKNNRKKTAFYRRKWLASNEIANIADRYRRRLNYVINKFGLIKRKTSMKILGCSFNEFKIHIEKQFLKGMTWENRSEWHIDHIVPISSAKTEEDVIKLNHYTNLRPLWAKDNLIKSNKAEFLI